MAPSFDTALLRRWIDTAVERVAAVRAEIDRINVFPVADHDTGSNLLITLRSAAAARLDGGPARAAVALASAALRGARGNSGLIVSQLFRGLAEELAADRETPGGNGRAAPGDAGPDVVTPIVVRPPGELLAGALRRAAALATAAVSVPRSGTALTVLENAASAVAAAVARPALPGRSLVVRDAAPRPEIRAVTEPVRNAGNGLLAAARTAADAARDVLVRAGGGPLELARAGVVDAGGFGLTVVLDALVAAAGGTPAEPPPARVDGPVAEEPAGPVVQPVFEVTYRLDDPGEAARAALRADLDRLGDSVGVAGDGVGSCLVHVHTTEAGPAIEAGLAVGRPSSIRVEALPPVVPTRERAVLLMIESRGAGELAREAGGDVLPSDPDPGLDDVLAAVRATGAGHVALLPCALHRRTLAETAAERMRGGGVDVVVVPSSSVMQGLAALAVHDPARRASDDVVAMAEAAAGTRTGGLRIAETEALTWAGRCRPGEVLGISDGEVVLIAPDLTVGALWLAHRMLTPGGELVTVLLGSGADDTLGERFADDLRRTHPEVDVLVHRGEQDDYPLVLGVE